MSQCNYGVTDHGSKVHIVDFDTDSMLALGNGDPDKARCGHTYDFNEVDSPTIDQLCQTCVDRYGIPSEFADSPESGV